jgi:hypothetical protein
MEPIWVFHKTTDYTFKSVKTAENLE